MQRLMLRHLCNYGYCAHASPSVILMTISKYFHFRHFCQVAGVALYSVNTVGGNTILGKPRTVLAEASDTKILRPSMWDLL